MRITLSLTILTLSISLAFGWQLQPSGFHIAIIDGEGALNNVQGRVAREPVIQVEDRNRKPVAGAYIEFDSPSNGASATFANGSTHFATTTNADGLAVASGLKNNGIAGAFTILVHVSFQGQSIGEVSIHQTNITPKLSKQLQQGGDSNNSSSSAVSDNPNITLSNNVVGIALGDQFIVNGSSTPSNANLLKGTQIQTLDKPTTLYMHDKCEYLVGPHSSVVVNPKTVTLQNGSLRAKRFGNCKIAYMGFWITGSPETDGVAAVSGQSLDVASVAGDVQVVNGAGDLIGTVTPGTMSTFGPTTVASGASIGGSGIPLRTALLLGSGVAIALAGLGLAVDAVLQPPSTSP